MQDILEPRMETTEETGAQYETSRRAFLGRAAVAGLGLAMLRLTGSAQAATMPKQPEADTGHKYPMAMSHAKTELQYRIGVAGPALLSQLTSEIAVDKATDPATLEFANFELREAIGVNQVLKEMKTPYPPMSPVAKATLAKIKSTPKGPAFDKAYAEAQLANHEFLRDHATTYLKNSAGKTSMAEMHGRHLAIVMLGAFKEHVVHTKNIVKRMA